MENQRVRLSKTMLKNSLLQLLKEKPLNQISIYEICQTAEINRTTFYRYYGSQMELLLDIEQDFLRELDDGMKDIIADSPNALLFVLNYLLEQRERFCILEKSLPSQKFAFDLQEIPSVGKIFRDLVDTSCYSEPEMRYLRQFVFQGTFAVLCDWLRSDTPEPVEEIADVLRLLRVRLTAVQS